MKKWVLSVLLMTLCLSMGSCRKVKAVINKVQEVQVEENQIDVKHFELEDKTSYKDLTATMTFTVDYPLGNSKAAVALRQWLYQTAVGEPSAQDITDGKQLFDILFGSFKEGNSPDMMKKCKEEEGIDGGEWFYNYRFKKEWENSNVVSFTYSADAFQVGNATSSAWIKDLTISKSDGRILGWEMFKSKTEVKSAIDDELTKKYGDDADLYDQGIPMPEAPLFLADGIRFDYGDYSIVDPHVYEDTGEYPYCLLPYSQYKHLLTAEACKLLGLEEDAAANTPVATGNTPDDNFFKNLVRAWDDMHTNRNFDDHDNSPYAETVKFYGMTIDKYDAAQRKMQLLNNSSDFLQSSVNIRVTRISDNKVRCDFDKHTTLKGQSKTYPSYLVFANQGDDTWLIVEESDQVTDKNLARKKK